MSTPRPATKRPCGCVLYTDGQWAWCPPHQAALGLGSPVSTTLDCGCVIRSDGTWARCKGCGEFLNPKPTPLEQICDLAKSALGPELIMFVEVIETLERIQDIAEEAIKEERHELDLLADERRNFHTPNP